MGGGGEVLVWKKQLNSNTLNTNYTVDELVTKRKLFVWRDKNERGEVIPKESVSSDDGNQIQLNPDEGKWGNQHIGLMSFVHKSGINKYMKDETVHVTDKNKIPGKSTMDTRDTGRTIQKLISDGDLFVCDEIIEPTASFTREGPRFTTATGTYSRDGAGHGGKRKKSRKPKRRNSRSNRTLNKSKK